MQVERHRSEIEEGGAVLFGHGGQLDLGGHPVLTMLRTRIDARRALPGKLSTTVTFFQAMLLLALVLALTLEPSAVVMP